MFVPGSLFCQNTSYKIIYDSIYPIMATDYPNAKRIWEKYCIGEDVDPAEQVIFLGFSLKNQDVEFYKKRIIPLIRSYGWSYNYSDTLLTATSRSLLLDEIKRNGLTNWTVRKSAKYYQKWAANNPQAVLYTTKINELIYADQAIRKCIPAETETVNSELYDAILSEFDYNNLLKIIDLCIANDGLIPNNFDDGVTTYYKINFIIWHNLKDPNTIQKTWNLLLPYIEKTYFAGKISYTLFMAYDKWNYQFFGYQYYGTLGENVPVKDADLLEERRKKYGL